MSIRNDLTELFELHKEIEETQKEVVLVLHNINWKPKRVKVDNKRKRINVENNTLKIPVKWNTEKELKIKISLK